MPESKILKFESLILNPESLTNYIVQHLQGARYFEYGKYALSTSVPSAGGTPVPKNAVVPCGTMVQSFANTGHILAYFGHFSLPFLENFE